MSLEPTIIQTTPCATCMVLMVFRNEQEQDSLASLKKYMKLMNDKGRRDIRGVSTGDVTMILDTVP